MPRLAFSPSSPPSPQTLGSYSWKEYMKDSIESRNYPCGNLRQRKLLTDSESIGPVAVCGIIGSRQHQTSIYQHERFSNTKLPRCQLFGIE